MTKRVKVLFDDRGQDRETAWCARLAMANRVRLDNMLFLHATPVWGDEIEIREDPREDHPRYKRVVKSGGRYAMILDYPAPADFRRLKAHLRKTLGIECEGCYGPADGEYGRLYLAVPKAAKAKQVFAVAQACVADVVGIEPPLGKPAPKPVPVAKAQTLFDAIDERDEAAFAKVSASVLRQRDDDGVPLLFYAVREGRTAIVERLIALGADVNDKRWPPLLAAVMRNRAKEARLLIAAGADPQRARDDDGDPVLVTAALREATGVMRVLLESKPPKDVVSLALLEAAGVGNLALCRLLVKHGGDPLWRSSKGNTPLAIARKRKRAAVVAYLKAAKPS